MTANGLIWVDCVWIAVLCVLPCHALAAIVHQEVALVVLSVLLVAARVWVLAGAVAQRCDNHVLHIVVDRQIDRWLLHLGLLLSATA